MGTLCFVTEEISTMRWTALAQAKAACAYFFVIPGLVYALFTSRLPALREQVAANEAEIGFILLSLGFSGLIGLVLCAPLIRRTSSRLVLRVASLLMLVALPLASLADSPLLLAAGGIFIGLSTGFADVAMNTQAIEVEKHFSVRCLAFMHAGYGFGALCGSVAAAVLASLGISPFWNFVLLMAVMAVFRPFVVHHLQDDSLTVPREDAPAAKKRAFALPPLMVILCGLVASCDYATEGSVGEWGALYLFSVKGTSEQTAALVYGVFSVSAVICRLMTDTLRVHFTDFQIMFCGSIAAVIGMATVLWAPGAPLTLCGYACMGLGLAPIVPILFSRAGSCPGVSASAASAVVSVLAYSSLLLFPPLIGLIAHAYGLQTALLLPLLLCFLLVAASFLFRTGPKATDKAA